MKTNHLILLFTILTLSILILAGCNQPAGDTETQPSDLNITQAYQTVDAQLTEAVAQTPAPPTATNLPDPGTATATPNLKQPTATEIPSEPSATFLPTFTHTPASRCDKAEAAYPTIDITIPDDTTIPAGNAFTKVWRVVNSGTCNWTAQYAVVFTAGEQMEAPDEVNIDQPVAPGQSIDIDVTMIAPQETGTYQGNWMLRNADGDIFGIGPNANDSFWVRIVVVEAEETITPTATTAPDPDVLVSGSITLSPDESIDLDTLQLGTSGSDLTYVQIVDNGAITGHQLTTLSGVTAGLYGTSQPNFGGCSSTTKAATTIDLQNSVPSTYYCYTTNQGLTGWVRFDGLDEVNNEVAITVLTWAALE